MDISLIHAGMAGGVALAAVPVILHLFMKQTPKRVIFPALRLIRERQKRSRKKLRVKNWLLLLARMALLALMALALARPRLFSQTSLGDQEVPTAVGLVFDTSLSMGYKERDKTRLDEAKERAGELLRKMPDSSQVFVIDLAEPGVPISLTPSAARKRIDGLVLRASGRHLNAALGQAYTAVVDCDKPRHEVYVLTDLARSAWDPTHPVEGLDRIKKVKSGVNTFILRLTPKEIHDVAVVEARTSQAIVNPGESIEVRASIRARGPAATRTAVFYLDGVLRHQEPFQIKADGQAEIKFATPKLDPATTLHQGYIKLTGAPDPLAFDDERFFTFKVQPPVRVLVVSDQADDAEYLAGALDPATLPASAPRTCRVDPLRTPAFSAQARDALKDYQCVFLNNVANLSEADWGRLSAYVHEGGGLVVGLGDRSLAENYNIAVAAQLIPGTLRDKATKANTTFGKLADLTHPLFHRYHKEIGGQLAQVPVYKHWVIEPSKGSRTLLQFADGAPALLERTFRAVKTGRVLLWATPLARRANPKSVAAWNEFPLPDLGYSFFLLMNQTVPYLAGTASETLNYEAGENAVLPIDPARRFKNYIVQGPDGKTTERLSPPATSDSLVVVSPQPIGQWTVEATGAQGEKARLGFSINPPAAEMEIEPLKAGELDTLFGKKGYALADDAESLKRVMIMTRVGWEAFPWLMAFILILVTAENLLANRFHRDGGEPAARRVRVSSP